MSHRSRTSGRLSAANRQGLATQDLPAYGLRISQEKVKERRKIEMNVFTELQENLCFLYCGNELRQESRSNVFHKTASCCVILHREKEAADETFTSPSHIY